MTAPDVQPAPAPTCPPLAALRGDWAALPLLLALFPVAVGLARTPATVGLVAAAFLFLAWHLRCLRGFAWALGAALGLSLLVFAGAALHYDVDNYLAPQVRLLVLPPGLAPDGAYSPTHCLLPQGMAAYGAALYRLFGSVDLGQSAFFLFAVAAWRTLREAGLTRLQAALLIVAPPAMPGLFNLMSDGCAYLLLLTALFALRKEGCFWLPLVAAAVACTFKTTAWLPTVLVAAVLLWHFPRRWWKVGLVGAAALLLVWPTLNLIFSGGLAWISDDFARLANDDARQMGHLARLLYVYVGHWTTALEPHLGTHDMGVDGLSSDAFGPIFRATLWASVAILAVWRRRFAGWWGTLALAWCSILLVPTTYVGYARYVPLLYVAGMLPLILRFPRVALLPAAALLAVPAAMLGWRFALSAEAVAVANHATAVHTTHWNLRATFRERLTEAPQPLWSGCLLYTYAMPEGHFPPMPRRPYEGIRATPIAAKAGEVRDYALRDFLPWLLTHPHAYLLDIARFRWHAFATFPRGGHDGLPTPARQ